MAVKMSPVSLFGAIQWEKVRGSHPIDKRLATMLLIGPVTWFQQIDTCLTSSTSEGVRPLQTDCLALLQANASSLWDSLKYMYWGISWIQSNTISLSTRCQGSALAPKHTKLHVVRQRRPLVLIPVDDAASLLNNDANDFWRSGNCVKKVSATLNKFLGWYYRASF